MIEAKKVPITIVAICGVLKERFPNLNVVETTELAAKIINKIIEANE